MTVYGWLQIIICGLQQFRICDNKSIAKHVKKDSIGTNIVMKYMEKLTRFVERKVENFLSGKFTLVFYGWSVSNTHFVSMFA